MAELECKSCGRVFKNEKDYLTDTQKFRVCSNDHLWFECSCKSCLVLEAGFHDWYDPSNAMRPSTASVFRSVKELGQLPMIPSNLAKLTQLIADPSTESRAIETELKKIPPLALGVIEMANMMKLSSDRKISSLEHAITYVGRHLLRDVITTSAVKGFSFATKAFSHESFWRESYISGQIAEYLAQKFAPHLEQDKVFLAAGLANVGKVVSAICFNEMTDQIFEEIQDHRKPMSWVQAEKNLDAISHCVLGEIAASLWGFPDYVVKPIMSHHTLVSEVRETIAGNTLFLFDDEDADEAQEEQNPLEISDIVALANQYSHWALFQPHRIDEAVLGSYLEKVNLNFDQGEVLGEEICDYLQKNWAEDAMRSPNAS